MTKEEFLELLFRNTDKLKKHRIEIFMDSTTRKISGSYDKQPFILEIREGICAFFGIKTDIKDYFIQFIEALSKILNRKPLCIYKDSNVGLMICEWIYKNEDKRFEDLLALNHISDLTLYEDFIN